MLTLFKSLTPAQARFFEQAGLRMSQTYKEGRWATYASRKEIERRVRWSVNAEVKREGLTGNRRLVQTEKRVREWMGLVE